MEFVRHRASSPLSLKMDALYGLCHLKIQSRHSITCLVCGKPIRVNKPLSYEWQGNISMNNSRDIYMVHTLRKHYQRQHPLIPIWNAVPESKFKDGSILPPLEYLIHQAMRAGGSNSYIPKEKTQKEFLVAFSSRMSRAISWIEWNPMVLRRLTQLGVEKTACETASDRLRTLLEVGSATINSTAFMDNAKNYTLEQLFNILMLYFSEMGRYKKCEVFGPQQSLQHS